MYVCMYAMNFLTIKTTRCTNFFKFISEMKIYMIRAVPLCIIRSYSLYTQQWYMSYRFVDSFRATGSVHSDLAAARKLCTNLYDIYHR
jgi:hypothetical protein